MVALSPRSRAAATLLPVAQQPAAPTPKREGAVEAAEAAQVLLLCLVATVALVTATGAGLERMAPAAAAAAEGAAAAAAQQLPGVRMTPGDDAHAHRHRHLKSGSGDAAPASAAAPAHSHSNSSERKLPVAGSGVGSGAGTATVVGGSCTPIGYEAQFTMVLCPTVEAATDAGGGARAAALTAVSESQLRAAVMSLEGLGRPSLDAVTVSFTNFAPPYRCPVPGSRQWTVGVAYRSLGAADASWPHRRAAAAAPDTTASYGSGAAGRWRVGDVNAEAVLRASDANDWVTYSYGGDGTTTVPWWSLSTTGGGESTPEPILTDPSLGGSPTAAPTATATVGAGGDAPLSGGTVALDGTTTGTIASGSVSLAPVAGDFRSAFFAAVAAAAGLPAGTVTPNDLEVVSSGWLARFGSGEGEVPPGALAFGTPTILQSGVTGMEVWPTWAWVLFALAVAACALPLCVFVLRKRLLEEEEEDYGDGLAKARVQEGLDKIRGHEFGLTNLDFDGDVNTYEEDERMAAEYVAIRAVAAAAGTAGAAAAAGAAGGGGADEGEGEKKGHRRGGRTRGTRGGMPVSASAGGGGGGSGDSATSAESAAAEEEDAADRAWSHVRGRTTAWTRDAAAGGGAGGAPRGFDIDDHRGSADFDFLRKSHPQYSFEN